MDSLNSLNLDPFGNNAPEEKYPLADRPEFKKKAKHSQKRRARSSFQLCELYRDKIADIMDSEGYKDKHGVVNEALDLVRTRYSMGHESSGQIKSIGRPRNKETEKRCLFRVDLDIARDIDCIYAANRRNGVTRPGLLEEGIDILLGTDCAKT